MVTFVIVAFTSICLGMAISVCAFGTGGKRKNVFRDIYYSIEDDGGIGVVYTKTGEYSAVLRMENPVQRFCSDTESYYDFTRLFASLAQTVGEGYALHKQDIFVRRRFDGRPMMDGGFLNDAYFRHFAGREYTDTFTYLTVTREGHRGGLFTYDGKGWNDFLVKINKVRDRLRDAGVEASFLSVTELRDYADRYFAMDFVSHDVSMDNFSVGDESISMGGRECKVYSIVDVDSIGLPGSLRPFSMMDVNNTAMPVDIVSAVAGIPGAGTVVYNQMIYVPSQRKELAQLERKKNRHASLPSPANEIAVEDIKKVQAVIARESRQLVYAHFNLVVVQSGSEGFAKCTNHLENAFSKMGIHISRTTYNQLELFAASFPGNCYAVSASYDRFLTLCDAAVCLMYKERAQRGEDSPLKIYYTDRQGVPVAIDITGKEGKVKYTDNSNFFCLGPSGSGKSFHINSVVRQLYEQGTDIVLVDTGNSYESLCEYVGGKYIAYTEEKPITMNPFSIGRDELNIEKTDFIKNLVLLIWKGSDGEVTKTEDRLVEQVVTEYYDAYFNGFNGYTPAQREDLRKTLESGGIGREMSAEKRAKRLAAIVIDIERRRKALKVTELSFNSFYDYSTQRMADICQENSLSGIDLSNYSFMMRRFCRGGQYEYTLNEPMDSSLLEAPFIVFEIDSIKENKVLFPLVTLIIMDVFLQKMRLRKNRKTLIIEEAWKAIASPLMAEYIKYMYKTARKFWGSVGVVTQELQDIIGSKIVKEAIINNSDVFMLLDQSRFKERFGDIKSVLGLTDVECGKLFTVNRLENKEGRSFFREVFIRRGTTSDVYGVEESPEAYMAYTTERAEKDALKLYKRLMGKDIREVIRRYCRDWKMSGIGKSIDFAKAVNKAGRMLGNGGTAGSNK